jgi:hypothetical protein
VWNLLSILCVSALLTSGAWVKATDAARLTHHELTLKDEKGKPLGQAHCVIRDKEGKYLANVISSVDGLIVAMAHPKATLLCVSKELEIHTGEVKAGRKIVTMKQPLSSCQVCDMVGSYAGNYSCCKANHDHCVWKTTPPDPSGEPPDGSCVPR